MSECRRAHCTCVGSNEMTHCLMDQWNEFDRPGIEEKEKKDSQDFKQAIVDGDITKAQKLLPKVQFKW